MADNLEIPTEVPATEPARGTANERTVPMGQSERLAELALRIDAAKHVSTTVRGAHLERRKFEHRVMFGVPTILLIAATTLLVRGDAIHITSGNVVIVILVVLASVGLLLATGAWLWQIHGGNASDRAVFELAEDWLISNFAEVDWKSRVKNERADHLKQARSRWFYAQVGGISAATLLLLGVLLLVSGRGSNNTPQSVHPPLRLEAEGHKLKLEAEPTSTQTK